MLKTILNMLVGALVAAGVGSAFAVIGTPPGTGFQMVDGTWLQQLAAGNNFSYQSGITAHAGGTQSACVQLNANIMLYEVDTVASSGDSVCLPYAQAGDVSFLRNAGGQTLNVFGSATNNPVTSAADTINGTAGSSAYTAASNTNTICFSAKNGVWSCGKVS
jgi:hypothetical protein